MNIVNHVAKIRVIDAAELILKYDQSHPLAVHKLIDLFVIISNEDKSLLIIRLLKKLSNSSLEIIDARFIDKVLELMESRNYELRLEATTFMNYLSEFLGLITFNYKDQLTSLINNILLKENSTQIILHTLDLLENLSANYKIYIQCLFPLIASTQESSILIRVFMLLEQIELKSIEIKKLLTFMCFEQSEDKYKSISRFVINYGLSHTRIFYDQDILEFLIDLIDLLNSKSINKEKIKAWKIIDFISNLILKDKEILNYLQQPKIDSKNEFLIRMVDFIVNNLDGYKSNNTAQYEIDQKIQSLREEEEQNQYDKLRRKIINQKVYTSEKCSSDLSRIFLYKKLDLFCESDLELVHKIIDIMKFTNDYELRICCIYKLIKTQSYLVIEVLNKLITLTLGIKDECEYGYELDIILIFYEITHPEILKILVANFKEYTKEQVFNNNFTLWSVAHDIVWHCAQHMSYPEFYHAWHSQPLLTPSATQKTLPAGHSPITQQLNFTELPTTLQNAIANNSKLNQAIHLVCVDGAKFSNPDNPALDIYIEMIEQNCPEREKGEPETLSHLKAYLRMNLKNLEKKVVLLFYTSEPDCLFSEGFLNTLTTFGSAIALISNQTCDNIQCFYPEDPHLVENIMQWIERMLLES